MQIGRKKGGVERNVPGIGLRLTAIAAATVRRDAASEHDASRPDAGVESQEGADRREGISCMVSVCRFFN